MVRRAAVLAVVVAGSIVCGGFIAACGSGSGSQRFSCTPTHFQDVSCSVVGMQYPWTLEIDGSEAQAVGMFSCEGTWSGNAYTCFTSAGLNAPPSGCEFDVVRNSDGSVDTSLASTGTTAHCVQP